MEDAIESLEQQNQELRGENQELRSKMAQMLEQMNKLNKPKTPELDKHKDRSLNVVLPTNFKVPKFEKYKGSSCPRIHLAMYCRKMASYIHQDRIPVHCFQDNLTGAVLSCYVNIESGRVNTWRDLAEAFVRQYKYNEDMAPDRSRLQNLSKADSKELKDYVQRWRELAAEV
ncbi:hypothetical protein CR513_47288, partial [Mucuna pruriens]